MFPSVAAAFGDDNADGGASAGSKTNISSVEVDNGAGEEIGVETDGEDLEGTEEVDGARFFLTEEDGVEVATFFFDEEDVVDDAVAADEVETVDFFLLLLTLVEDVLDPVDDFLFDDEVGRDSVLLVVGVVVVVVVAVDGRLEDRLLFLLLEEDDRGVEGVGVEGVTGTFFLALPVEARGDAGTDGLDKEDEEDESDDFFFEEDVEGVDAEDDDDVVDDTDEPVGLILITRLGCAVTFFVASSVAVVLADVDVRIDRSLLAARTEAEEDGRSRLAPRTDADEDEEVAFDKERSRLAVRTEADEDEVEDVFANDRSRLVVRTDAEDGLGVGVVAEDELAIPRSLLDARDEAVDAMARSRLAARPREVARVDEDEDAVESEGAATLDGRRRPLEGEGARDDVLVADVGPDTVFVSIFFFAEVTLLTGVTVVDGADFFVDLGG